METAGWRSLDERVARAFEAVVEALRAAGVAVLRRGDHPFIEAFEAAIAGASAIGGGITAWENRWAQRALVDAHPDGVSERAKAVLASAEAMTRGRLPGPASRSARRRSSATPRWRRWRTR